MQVGNLARSSWAVLVLAEEMNVAPLLAGPAQHVQSAGGPGGVGYDMMLLTALRGQLG